MASAFDVQHRDCFDSLAAMAEAGAADLILTSPPYPDARTDAAYGAEFDTSLAGYGRLGDAVFAALKPGGVCALNIDGPVRIWRPELGESERSLIAFRVALDWSDRVGFRYVERCVYAVEGAPGKHGPRWRKGSELVHVLARPGGDVFFDAWASTLAAVGAGRVYGPSSNRKAAGKVADGGGFTQARRRCRTTTLATDRNGSDPDHEAPFSPDLADAYVRCYSPPGGIIGDPFVGSGTVAFAVHRAGEGRTFIGGDLGIRQTHKGRACGRRWADIVNDGLAQGRLFP